MQHVHPAVCATKRWWSRTGTHDNPGMAISGGIPVGRNGGVFGVTGPVLLDDASGGGYGTIWCEEEEEEGTDWCVATA